MSDDESTLTIGPLRTLTGHAGLPTVPALTIVWHPDLERIGQVAPLTNLLEADVAHVSRDQPLFLPPGATSGEPLAHRGISRESVLDIAFKQGAFQLQPGRPGTEVEADGQPLREPRRVSVGDLQRGLILAVARRFVFCLHAIRFPISRSPARGLLGTSDGIEDVRRSVARVADKTVPVLLRGESGTGKELAARALHEAGPRAKGRFVAVNMAILGAERAAAELFGHKKGAFTGATADVAGHFRAASGGTIFLDEIGFTTSEVQPMLLRVLDDQEVQPLGASHALKVDVRIVAATDAKLERAVADQRLEPSLYNRLNTAVNIELPPLRERREDVGTLLVHFLKAEFRDPSVLQRLQDPDPSKRPWLSARDVAAIAASPLAGNVRSLLGLARNLVVKAGSSAVGDTHAVVAEFLSKEAIAPRELADARTAEGEELPAPAAAITPEAQLIDALERTEWNVTQAAAALGVHRSTFYRRLEKYPALRALVETEFAELKRLQEVHGGDLEELAKKTGSSLALVLRRLARRV